MKITELSINRPILIIILFLVLGILGFFSYTQLRYELLPNIATPFVTISTVYPGASPTEVETGVTRPIEEAVSGASQVKHVTAQSLENVSLITIEYRKEADPDKALQEAQRRVNEMVSTLPSGVKSPSLGKYSLSDLPILRLAVSSNLPSLEFGRLLSNQIKSRLAQVPGVGQILFIGLPESEVQINLNPARLRALNLSALHVANALKQANLNVPSGNIEDADANFSVRVVGKTDVIGQLRDIVIQTTDTGQKIRLNEVADVTLAGKRPENINRFLDRTGSTTESKNGTVGILIRKQSGANNVEVSQAVRAELTALERDYAKANLSLTIAQDGSEFTLAAADAVSHDLQLAIILVALVMFVFLHSLRSSLIVMVAIPSSLLSTFVFMYLFGFSLNLLTLLAISLVIGILVDDSIVVLESIYQQLEHGQNKRTAALEGRNSIGFSAMAITLVDVVVFVPLSLAPGIIGDIMREFALVVVIATLFSLLVSFTLTPMIASRFGQLEGLDRKTLSGRFGLWFERGFERLTRAYGQLLLWSLNHRLVTSLLVIGLFISSLLLPATGFIGSEFIAPTDKGEANFIVQLPEGTKLEYTSKVAQQLEKRLSQIPEVHRIFTNVGANPDGLIGISSANSVEFSVAFSPRSERKKNLTTLIQEAKTLAAQVPGARVRAFPTGILGSDNATPIILTVSGSSRSETQQYARKIAESLRNIPGAADVRTSGTTRKPEIRVDIDQEKVARYGLTTEVVGAAVRTALAGFDELKSQQADQSVNIRVRYAEAFRNRTDQLGDMNIPTASGGLVPLRQIATIQESFEPAILERRDRSNSVTVSSQVIGRATGDVGTDIRQAISQLNIPSSIQVFYGGDLELQDDSFGKLGLVFASAILFIYLIMVALYNSWLYPFVVLFSIPVAIVGALLALALTMSSLNIFSILGMIMMVGLVAKNAILLVDRANHNREQGMNLLAALQEAGQTRLRPILMTTLAMVIGMMPIALATGPGAELKTGLAWALIGGLSSSMFLTLVFVPTVYADFTRLQEKATRFFSKPSVSPKAAALLVGLLTISLQGMAQPTPVRLSLADVVTLVKRQNGEIQSTRYEVQKADARLNEAQKAALPTLNGTGQYVRYLKPSVFFFPAVSVDQTTGEFTFDNSRLTPVTATLPNQFIGAVNLSMPLLQPDLAVNQKLARLGQQQAEESVRAVSIRQVAEARKTYLTMLLTDEQRNLALQTIARAEQNLREARSLFKSQLATDADTLRAFVELENQRLALMTLARNIKLLKSSLATLLGIDPTTDLVLTDSLNRLLPPQLASKWIEGSAMENAMTYRPELRQLALTINQTLQQTELERIRTQPTLSLFGQLGTQAQLNNFSFHDSKWPLTTYLGLQLTIPLYNPTTTAKIQQARIGYYQTHQQLSYNKSLIANEVESGLVTLNEARDRIQQQVRVIRSAERSYGLTLGRYRQGLTKFSELTDAELALRQAQNNRLQAIYDYMIAQIMVDKAVGVD